MRTIQCFLGLALLVAVPASAQRLSGTVVPQHYSLWFTPDLEQETFRGRTSIDVVLGERTSTVTLHAAEITFGEVTITSGGHTQIAHAALDAATDTATFTVPDALAEGPATIEMSYTGVLNDKLRGFYISRANGRKYAVTQMEATDARRAFPSFDEPAYKATFDISLTLDDGDTAISNGRQVADRPGPDPGKHTLTFARTPRMSTYLVAMIVGDFVCREGAADGTPIRVCATPDKLALTLFALEAAEQQLAFFNAYFGLPYAFGKLDIIAVPDFSAGAMENAGAVVFRERLLLVDPATSSVDARRRVASVISHEIAHQWFGNLVTMKWWDDIWLNEGFATWMANKPLAAWRPEWRVELSEAAAAQGALGIDALRTTRPIRMKVETSAEINQVFDGIAYQKTAAVLRMIETYVGAEAFRTGVISYLKRFSFANAAGEDFWNELTRVTGRPVDRMMRTFVDQAGAPVLSFVGSCSATGSGELEVRMERFVGAPGATPPTRQRWTLPACFVSQGGQSRCELVEQERQMFHEASCEVPFANAGSRGYYFSEYTAGTVRALSSAPGLRPVERLSLLGDEWWMVRSGRHDIDVYLDLVGAFSGDETRAVTDLIAGRLAVVHDMVAVTDRPTFEAWIRSSFGGQLDALGLPGHPEDGDERQARRATLAELVGVTGNDADVQKRARALVETYLDDASSLPGTLAPTMLRVAATSGDASLYDRYVEQLGRLGSQPELYHRIFGALAWFNDPLLVKRTLEFALSPDVRSQDTGSLIGSLLTRQSSQEAAWELVRDNWPTIVAKLGEFQGIPTIVGSLGAFCSTARAREIRSFFDANPIPSSERALRQAIERVDNCVALTERQARPLGEWISRRQ